MAHTKGHSNTIRLYGFVEMDLDLLANLQEQEVDNILTNHIGSAMQEMKEDFWKKYWVWVIEFKRVKP